MEALGRSLAARSVFRGPKVSPTFPSGAAGGRAPLWSDRTVVHRRQMPSPQAPGAAQIHNRCSTVSIAHDETRHGHSIGESSTRIGSMSLGHRVVSALVSIKEKAGRRHLRGGSETSEATRCAYEGHRSDSSRVGVLPYSLFRRDRVGEKGLTRAARFQPRRACGGQERRWALSRAGAFENG